MTHEWEHGASPGLLDKETSSHFYICRLVCGLLDQDSKPRLIVVYFPGI